MFDPDFNDDSRQSLLTDRLVPTMLIIAALFGILIGRLFFMQMIDESSAKVKEDTSTKTKTVAVPATRGNIYDCKGVLLAYNDLQYNLEMYDSASLSTNAEKNAAIYSLIQLLREFNYKREFDFYIKIDEHGYLAFTVSGNALLRFKKNAYGLTSIDKLTEEQKAATAEDVFNFLRYGASPAKIFFLARCAFEGKYDDAALLKWEKKFFQRFFSQQFKRSCMPDGPKISVVSLSPRGDWRMASDAQVRLWAEELSRLG